MKEIQTNGITILFVEVPSVNLIFDIHDNYLVMGTNAMDVSSKKRKIRNGDNKGFINLNKVDWQILGKSTELSDEQMMLICDNINPDDSIYCDEFLDKLKSSYLSLLEANGIVDRNNASHPSDIDPTNRSHYDKIEQEWQQAQSKVKHYLVLKRI